jgi:hypothetical protein
MYFWRYKLPKRMAGVKVIHKTRRLSTGSVDNFGNLWIKNTGVSTAVRGSVDRVWITSGMKGVFLLQFTCPEGEG